MSVYRLREQVVASGRNAVLLVPQGPKDAPHSGDGKLELDEDGFLRFMTEVATWLHDNGNVPSARTGRIVLSAHSGGYGGAGGVLQRGGRNDAITDVLLFDAAYWYFAAFSDWGESVAATPPLERVHRRHEHRQHRLDGHGASAGTKLYVRLADTMTVVQLQTRAPTFVLTTRVAHDDLLQKYDWYRLFLQATGFQT